MLYKFVFVNKTAFGPNPRLGNNQLTNYFSETAVEKLDSVTDPKHVSEGEPSQCKM